jgi:hypothetical protein
MSILTGIVSHHNTLAGLTAAVANRAYPVTAPQSPVYPHYVFQLISTPDHVSSHHGNSQLKQVRIQFSIRAKTALEADAIATAIVAGYVGFAGMMGDVYVSGVRLANDMDDYEPTTKTYSRLIDLLMWIRPAL